MALAARVWFLAGLAVALMGCSGEKPLQQGAERTVRAVVQTKPGGPVEDVEMAVHQAPLDLPVVSASEADLQDDDLVLGVILDGQAMAYPIRFLALSEVVNGTVGTTSLAPTW